MTRQLARSPALTVRGLSLGVNVTWSKAWGEHMLSGNLCGKEETLSVGQTTSI